MNVVSKAYSTDRGTCQNPEFASCLVKIFAPANCPSVYLTDGISCHLQSTLSLSSASIDGLPSNDLRTPLTT